MEKLGVSPEIQHIGLRNREAQLMQKLQGLMAGGEKTADDRSQVEAELGDIRSKLTELDLQSDLHR